MKTEAKHIMKTFILTVLLAAGIHLNLQAQIPKGDIVIELEPVATGLVAPIFATHAGDGSGRLFIVEQSGQIRIVDNDVLLPDPFLDISGKIPVLNAFFDERGLLGLAFHPNYAANGRFFIRYSVPRVGDASEPCFGSSRGCHSEVLAEYAVSTGDANLADPNSEIILFTIDEPQFNHNAGSVAFGPDGFLYFTLGDGGGAHDGLADVPPSHGPFGNGQNIETALGSILRIDVDGAPEGQAALAYAIPPDNPFVDVDGVDEIYAYGLRNPYRFSFDDGPGGDGRLFLADVGQNLFEEINIVEKGGNYGWVIREGFHCFDPFNPTSPPANCPTTGPLGEPLIDPIAEYSHPGSGFVPEGGITVVGGFVYRNSNAPCLVGKYVFGDFAQGFTDPSGRLYFLDETEPANFELFEFQIGVEDRPYGLFVKGFGMDEQGTVYVCGSTALAPFGDTGIVERMVSVTQPTTRVVHIVADKDNTLHENVTGSLSNGIGPVLFSGRTALFDGGLIKRGLLQFDLAGAVPQDAVISSATLTLNMSKAPNALAQTIELHRVEKDWGEGDSITTGGGGAPATAGDATWLHTFFDTDFWTNAGGDFSATVSAGQSVGAVGTYNWGSSAPMVADVQGWLDDPGSNFGWLLLGDESEIRTVKQFDTRESSTVCNRPVLTVEYTSCPVCNSSADLDGNCAIHYVDFSLFALHWLSLDCCPQNNWCDGADMIPLGNPNGAVDLADFEELVSQWLN